MSLYIVVTCENEVSICWKSVRETLHWVSSMKSSFLFLEKLIMVQFPSVSFLHKLMIKKMMVNCSMMVVWWGHAWTHQTHKLNQMGITVSQPMRYISMAKLPLFYSLPGSFHYLYVSFSSFTPSLPNSILYGCNEEACREEGSEEKSWLWKENH